MVPMTEEPKEAQKSQNKQPSTMVIRMKAGPEGKEQQLSKMEKGLLVTREEQEEPSTMVTMTKEPKEAQMSQDMQLSTTVMRMKK